MSSCGDNSPRRSIGGSDSEQAQQRERKANSDSFHRDLRELGKILKTGAGQQNAKPAVNDFLRAGFCKLAG